MGNTSEAGAFAAPEILAGGRPDARSEVYSLARTTQTLLTGSVPSALGYVAGNPPGAGMSPGTQAVLDRATSHNPAVRYQTAVEFAAELSAADAQAVGWAGRSPSNAAESSPRFRPSKGPALPLAALLLGIAALVVPLVPDLQTLTVFGSDLSRRALAVVLPIVAILTGIGAFVGQRRMKWAAGVGIAVAFLSLAFWGISFLYDA